MTESEQYLDLSTKQNKLCHKNYIKSNSSKWIFKCI